MDNGSFLSSSSLFGRAGELLPGINKCYSWKALKISSFNFENRPPDVRYINQKKRAKCHTPAYVHKIIGNGPCRWWNLWSLLITHIFLSILYVYQELYEIHVMQCRFPFYLLRLRPEQFCPLLLKKSFIKRKILGFEYVIFEKEIFQIESFCFFFMCKSKMNLIKNSLKIITI